MSDKFDDDVDAAVDRAFGFNQSIVYIIPRGVEPNLWGPRGVVDSALRLLEQGEISRLRAREILEALHRGVPEAGLGILDAPWDELRWGE